MRIILLFILGTSLWTNKGTCQVLYWNFPIDEQELTSDSIYIILPPFDWGYNGHFQPSGYKRIEELIAFMRRHLDYKYTIKIHTKSTGHNKSNVLISEMQRYRLEKKISEDSLLTKRYEILVADSTSLLIKNECINNYSKDSLYWHFLNEINERVEILMYK